MNDCSHCSHRYLNEPERFVPRLFKAPDIGEYWRKPVRLLGSVFHDAPKGGHTEFICLNERSRSVLMTAYKIFTNSYLHIYKAVFERWYCGQGVC